MNTWDWRKFSCIFPFFYFECTGVKGSDISVLCSFQFLHLLRYVEMNSFMNSIASFITHSYLKFDVFSFTGMITYLTKSNLRYIVTIDSLLQSPLTVFTYRIFCHNFFYFYLRQGRTMSQQLLHMKISNWGGLCFNSCYNMKINKFTLSSHFKLMGHPACSLQIIVGITHHQGPAGVFCHP